MHMRRSNLSLIILAMYNHDMLRDDDMKHFSESAQKYVLSFQEDD